MTEENKAQAVKYQGLYDWMQSIVVTFLLVLFLLTFVGRTMGVRQSSMMPTLHDGDRMIVRSIFYTADYGDIIIFSQQTFEDGAALVKRVIALAGDVVDINTQTGTVYVNGEALFEPFTSGPSTRPVTTSFPYTVPEGHVFVLGDNRNGSTDSRDVEIGSVDQREIIGQVVAVVAPFSRARLFVWS